MSSTLQPTRPAPDTSTRGESAASSRRDPWFDNAKVLLVTLVVAGHTWVLLPDSQVKQWAYDFLYLWHMPAFVMVTGYLSRRFSYTRRNLSRLVTTVVVPYFVFEAAMSAFRVEVGDEQGIDRLFLEPHWPMWFLAVLFLWRLATPLLRRLPTALAISVVVSLLGGLLAGDVLDLGRATGMLPFFVLGLLATPEQIERLRSPRARRVAPAVLAAGAIGAYFVHGNMQTEWLYWRSGYDTLGVTVLEGMAIQGGLLVAATVLALSALALVPTRGLWFTGLGAASMTVYLCHGFFVKAAEYTGALDWAAAAPVLGLLVATGAASVLAVALASPPVSARLSLLVDPVGTYRRWSAARRTPAAD